MACARMKKDLGAATKVIATGGLAPLIASESKAIEEVDEFLTLEGLRLIFDSEPAERASLSRRERPACPITADFLPDNMKKHRGPQGARALRMMAAKAPFRCLPDLLSVVHAVVRSR